MHLGQTGEPVGRSGSFRLSTAEICNFQSEIDSDHENPPFPKTAPQSVFQTIGQLTRPALSVVHEQHPEQQTSVTGQHHTAANRPYGHQVDRLVAAYATRASSLSLSGTI